MSFKTPQKDGVREDMGSPNGTQRVSNPWTFLTNHSHVLLCLHQEPFIRLREVASMVGITERAVQRIVRDLEEAGEIQRIRSGRRNRYVVDPSRPLRHPLESHRTIGELLKLLSRPGETSLGESS